MTHIGWRKIGLWIDRMTDKYGAVVYDKKGNRYDWGQVLCREVYGEDWKTNPNFRRDNEQSSDNPPQSYILETCKDWQKNGHPDWVNTDEYNVEILHQLKEFTP